MLLVLASLILVFTKGLQYGIDFAGGIEVQVQFKNKVDSSQVRKALADADVNDASVVGMEGQKQEYLLSLLGKTEKTNELSNIVKSALMKAFGKDNVTIRRIDVDSQPRARRFVSNDRSHRVA